MSLLDRLGVWLPTVLLWAVLLACDAAEQTLPADTPQPPAASQIRESEEGVYTVQIWPRAGEMPLHRLHEWVLRITDPMGEVVEPTRVAVTGGMPQHGHGFTTQPRVTHVLPGGDLLIEGMRFHMSGVWTLQIEIVGAPGADVAIFQLQVEP